jgi:hypothetical protein
VTELEALAMAPNKCTTRKQQKVKNTEEKEKAEDASLRLSNAVATLNNYSEEDVEKMQLFFHTQCSYGVYGKEVGESGTPHLQIYFELLSRLSIRQIRKHTPSAIANIQPGFAPDPKARAGYCKKGEDPKKPEDNDDPNYYNKYFEVSGPGYEGYEHGKENIKSQGGQRTDLKKVADSIKNGEVTIRQLRADNPMVIHQYGRVLQEVENDSRRLKFRCNEMTTCTWIHGLPGRGKSHAAFIDECISIGGYHPDRVYDWDLEQEFQCGYEGQDLVIINEYKGPHQIKYGTLLKLIDKWPMKIKRKNPLAAMEFTSKHIVITSIFHPTEIQWNLHSSDDLDQLLDRIVVKKVEGENRRKEAPLPYNCLECGDNWGPGPNHGDDRVDVCPICAPPPLRQCE